VNIEQARSQHVEPALLVVLHLDVIRGGVATPVHSPGRLAKAAALSLNSQQRRGFRPKILEAIEVSLILGENMDDGLAKIENDPTASSGSLAPLGTNPGFRHSLDEGAVDGAQLPFVLAGSDHEVVGKGRHLVDIQHYRITRRSVADNVRQKHGAVATFGWRRKRGVRITLALSQFAILQPFTGYRLLLVGPAGIEPATLGL
jgi:hypothetical protein